MKVGIVSFVCDAMIPFVEIMATRLRHSGFELVSENRADIVIIASCALNSGIRRKCLDRAQLSSASGKKVLVVGCLPEIGESEILSIVPSASMAGVSSYLHAGSIVEKMAEGYRVRRLDDRPKVPVGGVWDRINPLVAYIPISEGCSHSCTFCACRIARGSLISYPPDRILASVQKALASGAVEIVLVADDVGSYGHDIGISLPALIRKILTIKGEFKIRLGYMNPASFNHQFDDLLACYSHPKMYRYIHLNIQSASQNVLDAMRREYSAEMVGEMIRKLRESFNGFTVVTDVLVGHPSENDDDFKDTVAFLKKERPDSIKVYAYSSFKKNGEPVPSWKVKQRYEEMLRLKDRLESESSEKWVGWRGDVVVMEKIGDGMFLAKNYAYRNVVVKSDVKPGDRVQVEVKDFKGFDLLT